MSKELENIKDSKEEFVFYFTEVETKKIIELISAFEGGELYAFHIADKSDFLLTPEHDLLKLIHSDEYLFGTLKSKPVFNVEVNPFLKEAKFFVKASDEIFESIMYYDEVDEWSTLRIMYDNFNVHFHYDKCFTVSIYPILQDGATDHNNSFETNLTIKLNEKIS